MTCSHVSRILPGCEKLQKIPIKKEFIPEYSSESNHDFSTINDNSNTNNKFSFLQNKNRRASAPARVVGDLDDFIPLGNGDKNNNTTVKNSFFTKAKNASLINSKSSAISKDTNLEDNLSGIKRPLTLLELEQQNKRDKKNRRKTLDTRPSDSNSNRVGIQSVGYSITSLSSIQNMFKQK